MKAIVVVCSFHHQNTQKIAERIAGSIGAPVIAPRQIIPRELLEYDLVGFGSGIYDAMHHKELLALADNLMQVSGKKAFIFSTDGVPRIIVKSKKLLKDKMHSDHEALRKKLQYKGYTIIVEYGCAGFNTNSLLRLFGGFNNGMPDEADLALAEEFAKELKNCLESVI